MNCSHCGNLLREGAAFCDQCGRPVAPAGAGMVCPACGKPAGTGMVYCDNCGSRLVSHSAPESPAPVQPSGPPVQPGDVQLLRTLKGVGWFEGGSPGIFVTSTVLGTLSIYTDRVEYKRNKAVTFVTASPREARKRDEVYRMTDIVDVQPSKIGLNKAVMVLTLRNGVKYTFTNVGTSEKAAREIIELIRRYCSKS